MVKIINDKYYTPKDLAKRLIDTTIKVLVYNGVNDIEDIIEPSAGNGAFSSQIKCTAYDIESEFTEQMKQLLEFNTIREYVNSISAKRISVMRLYKYLKDNIKGIE